MEENITDTQPSLSRAQLNERAKTLLRVARVLMENGAETRRVFETVKGIGSKMNLDALDILVTHRSVLVTVASGPDAVTRIVRVGTLGVNLSRIAAVSQMFRDVQHGITQPEEIDDTTKQIRSTPLVYPDWLTLVMAGLACGGFSFLSGADARAFVACSLSAAIGLFVRRAMASRHFQPMLCVFSAAFVSASLATIMTRTMASQSTGAGIAASVLYLVPGVPMINSVADLVKGHLMTGLARALTVAITAVFVSSGLILAMQIMGFKY